MLHSFIEQVGKFLQNLSTFLAGFVIAFTKGWRLVLVLLPTIPLVVVAAAAMAITMSKMSSRGQAASAEGGAVVEETVGAIRTVRHTKEKFFFGFEHIYGLVSH